MRSIVVCAILSTFLGCSSEMPIDLSISIQDKILDIKTDIYYYTEVLTTTQYPQSVCESITVRIRDTYNRYKDFGLGEELQREFMSLYKENLNMYYIALHELQRRTK